MPASASTLPSDFPSRIVFLFAIVGSQAYILGLLLPLMWNTTRTPPLSLISISGLERQAL